MDPDLLAGSSPLTRGKLLQYGRVQRAHGLIPAHAGKTQGDVMSCQASTAHPRSRGENRPCEASECCLSGSSPLTRGKRPSVRSLIHRSRLIPAHAGKT